VIPADVSIRFEVAGTAGGWLPTDRDAVRAAVLAAMNDTFRVETATINLATDYLGWSFEWPFTMQITAAPRSTYGALADVESMLVHAVYEATGYIPTVSVPDAGQAAQPDLPADEENPIAKFLKSLEGDLIGTLVLIAIVLVALFYFVGGKTTRVGVAL
jgi:hypothetical protein